MSDKELVALWAWPWALAVLAFFAGSDGQFSASIMFACVWFLCLAMLGFLGDLLSK